MVILCLQKSCRSYLFFWRAIFLEIFHNATEFSLWIRTLKSCHQDKFFLVYIHAIQTLFLLRFNRFRTRVDIYNTFYSSESRAIQIECSNTFRQILITSLHRGATLSCTQGVIHKRLSVSETASFSVPGFQRCGFPRRENVFDAEHRRASLQRSHREPVLFEFLVHAFAVRVNDRQIFNFHRCENQVKFIQMNSTSAEYLRVVAKPKNIDERTQSTSIFGTMNSVF